MATAGYPPDPANKGPANKGLLSDLLYLLSVRHRHRRTEELLQHAAKAIEESNLLLLQIERVR